MTFIIPEIPTLILDNKKDHTKSMIFFSLCALLDDVRNCFIENPDHTWFPIVDIWRLGKISSKVLMEKKLVSTTLFLCGDV
jgi:hypothetical protein